LALTASLAVGGDDGEAICDWASASIAPAIHGPAGPGSPPHRRSSSDRRL